MLYQCLYQCQISLVALLQHTHKAMEGLTLLKRFFGINQFISRNAQCTNQSKKRINGRLSLIYLNGSKMPISNIGTSNNLLSGISLSFSGIAQALAKCLRIL